MGKLLDGNVVFVEFFDSLGEDEIHVFVRLEADEAEYRGGVMDSGCSMSRFIEPGGDEISSIVGEDTWFAKLYSLQVVTLRVVGTEADGKFVIDGVGHCVG